jgi:hypothetical protein
MAWVHAIIQTEANEQPKTKGEANMLNEKKITWCENWLKKTFSKYKGIERNLLFEMAAKAKLYTPGTYGSELSKALQNLNVQCDAVKHAETGEFLYYAFHM